jgi:polyisoprenoid-binding protein YceI
MTIIHAIHPSLDLAPATWAIDPGHAEVAFIGRHFGLTKVRGRFTGINGEVVVDDPVERSTIDVTIDMASVESGSRDRDEHLRSSDLFDVAAHPTANFRSTGIVVASPLDGRIDGELTIKGITRPVWLDVDYLGQVTDPWGGERAVFSASTVINREDFGVSWNMPLDAGRLLVSREIRIEIDVELVRQSTSG